MVTINEKLSQIIEQCENAKTRAKSDKKVKEHLDEIDRKLVDQICITYAKGLQIHLITDGPGKAGKELVDSNYPFKFEENIMLGIINKTSVIQKLDDELMEKLVPALRKYYNKNTFIIQKGQPNQYIENLNEWMKNNLDNIKIINNSVKDREYFGQYPKNTTNKLDDSIMCTTSEVCDGMGSFGSCSKYKGKEYFSDMSFEIHEKDRSNSDNPNKFYYGTSNIKYDKSNIPKSVVVTHGFTNLFRKDIKGNPMNVQTFPQYEIDISKGAVLDLTAKKCYNEILILITNAKKNLGENSELDFWKYMCSSEMFKEFFKTGSVKSIGDIFQEINSIFPDHALEYVEFENGEFKVKYGAEKFNNRDITFGWMGDRPSAARIIIIGIEGENVDKEQILKKSLSGFVYSRRKNKDEDFKLENVVLFSTLPEADMNQLKSQ